MCWAAAASNVLAWSGWGQAGGNANADQIFQYYCSHWSDVGSFPQYGVQWWFDGTNPGFGRSDCAQIEVDGGRFYPTQVATRYCHTQSDDALALGTIDQYLRAGWATSLAIYGGGGHAITCWGFDYDSQNPSTYRGIWVTDSDDAKHLTNAPDELRYYNVQLSNGQWYLQDYYGTSNTWYIGQVMGLERRPANLSGNSGDPLRGNLSTTALALAQSYLPLPGVTLRTTATDSVGFCAAITDLMATSKATAASEELAIERNPAAWTIPSTAQRPTVDRVIAATDSWIYGDFDDSWIEGSVVTRNSRSRQATVADAVLRNALPAVLS